MSLLDSFPLLKQIDNLGLKVGEFLPDVSRGNVIIDNTLHSFGSERRFSDLLERYTLIEQELIVELATLNVGDDVLEDSDFGEVWRAIITNVVFNDKEVRLNVSRSAIPIRTITKQITTDVFPSAPSDSLGRHLPIVFSNTGEPIEVEPIAVTSVYTESSENRIDFAYATTLADDFVSGGISSIEMLNAENQYQAISFLATVTTPILSFPLEAAGGSTDGSFEDLPELLVEVAFKLKAGQNVTAGQVITGVDWYLSGPSSYPTDEFNIQCKIYSSANGMPENVLASDTITELDSSKVTLVSAIGDVAKPWKFRFTLNRPVIIPDGEVFVAMSRSDVNENWLFVRSGGNPLPITAFEKYVRVDADDRREWAREIKTEGRETVEVFGLAMSDVTTGGSSSLYENGLGHAVFTLKMRDQSSIPDLTDLRLVAKVIGLLDDSSGTVTGTPNELLQTPLHQARGLLHQWNGTSWVENRFDESVFSASHTAAFSSGRWEFRTAGTTRARTTVRDLLIDIMRCCGSRIVPIVSGDDELLALWAWGATSEPVATIDDEFARLIKAEVAGIETIINHFQAAFLPTIKTGAISLLADGSLAQYKAAFDSRTASNLDVHAPDITASINTYGLRPLANTAFDFIASQASAKSLAAFYLRTLNRPRFTVEIAVPYNKYDVGLMDVVNLKMVNLPAFYGTSFDARPPLAGTDENSVDVALGHYWKRSKTYRGQILGNEIRLSQGAPLERVLTINILNDLAIT